MHTHSRRLSTVLMALLSSIVFVLTVADLSFADSKEKKMMMEKGEKATMQEEKTMMKDKMQQTGMEKQEEMKDKAMMEKDKAMMEKDKMMHGEKTMKKDKM